MAHELTHTFQQGLTQKIILMRQEEPSQTRRFGAPIRSEAGGEGSEISGDIGIAFGTMFCQFAPLPDSMIVQLVREFFFQRYPLAFDHLDHYLLGTGGNFTEDIKALLQENPSVVTRVEEIIRMDGHQTGTYADSTVISAPIRQSDYDSEDWRLALGNIDEISWEFLEEPDTNGYALVRLSIRDPYHWSPDDDRNTDCLHELMERQKENGAAEFLVIGVRNVRLHVVDATQTRP